ncbi:MAG: FkbM family methyltransferase [Cyanobacteria bacterium P01_E01_bin.6]
MILSSLRDFVFRVRYGFKGVPRKLDPFIVRFDESLRRWNLDSEDNVRQVIHTHLNPGDVFIDIGANFGMHTLYAAKHLGTHGKVFSFEPVSDNVALLKHHVHLNQLHQQIVIEPSAVSNSEKSHLSFFLAPEACSVTASLQQSQPSQSRITVPNIRFDDYWKNINRPIQLIKIDVEGAELEVLRGAEKTLKKWKPLLLIEVHGFALPSFHTSLQEFQDFLRQLDYQEHRLSENDDQNDDYFQALYRTASSN